MAGQPVPFPNIRPSKRSFTAGEYPTEIFRAQNGASTAIRFGNRQSNCKLQLQFQNITDENARLIFEHYEKVNGEWDYVDFTADGLRAMDRGMEDFKMKERLRGEQRGLEVRYRYASPPQVDFTFLDRCTVSCEFIGYLSGGID